MGRITCELIAVTSFEQRLQHSAQAEFRLWIAERRRFAENENAHRVGRFDFRHGHCQGRPGHVRTKKPPAKPIVLNQIIFSLNRLVQEEGRGMPNARHAQTDFQNDEKQRGQKHHRDQTKGPTAGLGNGRGARRRRFCRRAWRRVASASRRHIGDRCKKAYAKAVAQEMKLREIAGGFFSSRETKWN